MTPAISNLNCPYGAFGNLEFPSNISNVSVFNVLKAINNFLNLAFCKLRGWMIFPSCKPSLFKGVNGVIFFCSKKQMKDIAAWWIITGMKHAESFRNWTAMQNPTSPVRLDFLPLTTPPNRSVSVFVPVPGPIPTTAHLFDLGKESFRKVGRKSLRGQVIRRNFDLHFKYLLMCQALGCFSSAGATSFYGRIFCTRSQAW